MSGSPYQPMQALQRKGAWLIAAQGRWQMASVQGPIAIDGDDREYFRVETACREVLLVSRRLGERGMRELRLDSFITPLTREERNQETRSDHKTVA